MPAASHRRRREGASAARDRRAKAPAPAVRTAVVAMLMLAVTACVPPASTVPGPAPVSQGTDAYGGPLDMLFNKGFAVAQWEDRERHIFEHRYAWGEVSSSLTKPGGAVRRAGGWGEVLKVHALPFYYGGLQQPQWVTNYFGHVLEGGLSYRRLWKWNLENGVPLAGLSAALVTYAASVVNEAYETAPPADGSPPQGNAGIVMDLLVFDPLGILLFSVEGLPQVADALDAAIWPAQASLIVPSGALQNNGQSMVFKLPLPGTRHRLFVRGGMGIEGGLSFRRRDGTDVSFAVGGQSYSRVIDSQGMESARFNPSASAWIDRGGTLLAGLTLDRRTDRRIALNVYPGVLSVAGVTFGSWLLLDSSFRPYVGFTGRRTLGMGLGLGF